MAIRTVITLEGFDSVRAAVQRVPDEVRVAMADVVQKTAFGARQRTIALAPRATGLLRSSITSSSRGLSGRVDIAGPAYYWRFPEYGTRFRAATPFVRPAAELESIDFTERVRQVGLRLERDFSAGRLL
jgi:HK97 gp10 family phage protein